MFRVLQTRLQSNSMARSLDAMLSDFFGTTEPKLVHVSAANTASRSGGNHQSGSSRRRRRRKRPVSDGTSFRTSWF